MFVRVRSPSVLAATARVICAEKRENANRPRDLDSTSVNIPQKRNEISVLCIHFNPRRVREKKKKTLIIMPGRNSPTSRNSPRANFKPGSRVFNFISVFPTTLDSRLEPIINFVGYV